MADEQDDVAAGTRPGEGEGARARLWTARLARPLRPKPGRGPEPVPPSPRGAVARAARHRGRQRDLAGVGPAAPRAARPRRSAWPRRLFGGRLEAQSAWNAHQVRLDNEIVRYVEERFAVTHRHYDRLLGREGRRADEIDERHVLLERELVLHVQDLARRIDLVLAESSRGRAGQELVLADLRARLERLEEALRRRA